MMLVLYPVAATPQSGVQALESMRAEQGTGG